jgi:hypothetical protein
MGVGVLPYTARIAEIERAVNEARAELIRIRIHAAEGKISNRAANPLAKKQLAALAKLNAEWVRLMIRLRNSKTNA